MSCTSKTVPLGSEEGERGHIPAHVPGALALSSSFFQMILINILGYVIRTTIKA